MTYKKPYLTLFNGITDSTKTLENVLISLEKANVPHKDFEKLEHLLLDMKALQAYAEEQYISNID